MSEKAYITGRLGGEKYALITETGNKLTLVISDTNKLTATLYTKYDVPLSSSVVTLPTTESIESGYYDEATREIVFVLVSGKEIRIPVEGLMSNLATKTELQVVEGKIPTKTSQLTNDSNFLTEHQDISGKQDKLTSGDNITITNNVISAVDTIYDDTQVKADIATNTTDISNIKSGTTTVGMALNYASGGNIESALSNKQNKLTAGNGIDITSDTISVNTNAYKYINQIADYLFEVQYTTENIDYDYANEYFKTATDADREGEFGACSGVVKNGQVLRHLDWTYDNNVEFIVRRPTDKENGLYGSIGVCACVKELTKEFVESGKYHKKYKLVPFDVTDGINEYGLYIQSNVVPLNGITYNINPTSATECCVLMFNRYVLDHCKDFADVENALNTIHLYSSNAVKYGIHWLIAQGNDWRIIELTADGHKTVGPVGTSGVDCIMPYGIITNFRNTGRDNAGLSFTDNNINWDSIEDYGVGVERFEEANKVFINDWELNDLRPLLKYTNTYTATPQSWKTELAGETYEGHKLTVLDAKNTAYDTAYETLLAQEKVKYLSRTREDGKDTWQTTHSAIYDLSSKSFNIAIQERLDKTYYYELIQTEKQNKLTAGNNVTIDSNSVISAVDTIYDDTQVRGLITQETTTRETADITLQTNIDKKQDILTAGSNIQFNGNVISATDTTYTAGDGITITNNAIAIDANSTIAIHDNRISDANKWLTNGYTKTSAEIPTINLPSVCTEDDRWGVLLFVAENNENHAGLQQYFPIDGTYKGRVFYRSVTGYSAEIEPEFGEWNILPWSSEKQDTLIAGENIVIDNSNISAIDTKYQAGNNVTIDENNIINVDLSLYAKLTDLQIGKEITAQQTVGGIQEGTTYPATTTLATIIEDLLGSSTPTTKTTLYFGSPTTVPTTLSDFTTEQIEKETFITNGVTHQYVTTSKHYTCFAYEKSIGELTKIYQNGLTTFNLIGSFNRTELTYNSKIYYLYCGVDKEMSGTDSYQFLFN